jgi:hypothetical protein
LVALALLAGTWLVGGCAMTADDGYALAALTGDAALARDSGWDQSGFLGSGAIGATGEAQFADGRAATVALGPKYFSGSGRWCRRFHVLAPGDGTGAAPPEEQTACSDRGGWQRSRPLVVTRIPAAQR